MSEKIVMPKLGMVMSEGAISNSSRIKVTPFPRVKFLPKLRQKKLTTIWKRRPQEFFIR